MNVYLLDNVSDQLRPTSISLVEAYKDAGYNVDVMDPYQLHIPHDDDLLLYRLQAQYHWDAEINPLLMDQLSKVRRISNPLPTIIVCRDKRLTLRMFEAAGLKVLPWRTGRSAIDALLRYPLVCKRARGGGDVRLIHNEQQLIEMARQIHHPLIHQQYIENAHSYRVIATPNEALSVYLQMDGGVEEQIGSKRVPASSTNLERELAELGVRMCRIVGGHIVGCDILEDEHGQLWPLQISPSFEFDIKTPQLAEKMVETTLQLIEA